MAKSCNQKTKILYLERILLGTGENCVVTMQEILDQLAENEITAERKSIYDDMEALRAFGMDVKFKRGRPGGYYLAGQKESSPSKGQERIAPEAEACEEVSAKVEKPEACEEVSVKGEKPETAELSAAGIFSKEEPESDKKMMKLLCSNEIRLEAEAYFGAAAQMKEKGSDSFVVNTPLLENPMFYGWLTAMGRKVHILKPKKCVQAYRDYLKMLAKSYKEV